jgi:hypothetical protein
MCCTQVVEPLVGALVFAYDPRVDAQALLQLTTLLVDSLTSANPEVG